MANPENVTVLGDLGKDEKTSPRLLTLKRREGGLVYSIGFALIRWRGFIPKRRYGIGQPSSNVGLLTGRR
jgi:hypothetical protein